MASQAEQDSCVLRNDLRRVARDGHDVRVRVNGTSMLASIWPGDAIMVRPLRDATALDWIDG